MLTLLDLGRADIFAYRMTDILSDEDIKEATDAFDAILRNHDTVQIYAELADVRGLEARALWLDLVYSLNHLGALRHIGRIALVTDTEWIRRLGRLEGRLLPVGLMNVYDVDERDDARAWILDAPRAAELARPFDWTGLSSLDAMWSDADWFTAAWEDDLLEETPRAPRFGHTVHRTHVMLREIASRLGTAGTVPAYHALRSVLHTLRDRLPDAEAADLAAQLTTIVRGVFYEGYRPGRADEKLDREAFLEAVRSELREDAPFDPEDAIRAVSDALAASVSEGEWNQVLGALPRDVRALFEAPVEVEA